MIELPLYLTTAQGLEPLLADELRALGITDVQLHNGGIGLRTDLAHAYQICLWSRTASRVLSPLAEVSAVTAEALYEQALTMAWEEHISPTATLAVDFHGSNAELRHSQYGAQRVKDAIVDRLRQRTGARPSVDTRQPDIRINAHLRGDKLTLALDLSGDSLHRRGYRVAPVAAPLKENLAAALLLKLDWPALAAQDYALFDPMCGSGTFLIEAAMIAADSAPGLLRSYWGFNLWRQHNPVLWRELLDQARARRAAGLAKKLPLLLGQDQVPRAVQAARSNAERAGLSSVIRFSQACATRARPPAAKGLLVCNPPYGERLGEVEELQSLYAGLGDALKARFQGWKAAIFTGNPDLGKNMGLRALKTNSFHNGPLPCKLLQFSVEAAYFVNREALAQRAEQHALQQALAEGGEAFANRVRKNLKHLGRWAQQNAIECYRVYDADLPEYAVAVDIYGQQVHVQEYAPPTSIDPRKAEQRLGHVMTLLPSLLNVPADKIALKVRARQRGAEQYQRQNEREEFFAIREGSAQLWVNLHDYLDTGLFLDHRPLRLWIAQHSQGLRFLNLFCYTGAATVHAALGGARSTTSVDLSATYLNWLEQNLILNDVDGPQQRIIRDDCRQWLQNDRGQYDLIFLDPPTFSNSKRMQGTLDIQRDHVELLRLCLERLAPQGTLLFSNNQRGFKLDQAALADLQIEDLTRWSIPKDFERNQKIHQCWRITRRVAGASH